MRMYRTSCDRDTYPVVNVATTMDLHKLDFQYITGNNAMPCILEITARSHFVLMIEVTCTLSCGRCRALPRKTRLQARSAPRPHEGVAWCSLCEIQSTLIVFVLGHDLLNHNLAYSYVSCNVAEMGWERQEFSTITIDTNHWNPDSRLTKSIPNVR
jgi:hypothetical protein